MLNGPVFQILRVYAISGRRWEFPVLVGMLNIFPNVLPMVRDLFRSQYHPTDLYVVAMRRLYGQNQCFYLCRRSRAAQKVFPYRKIL